MGNASEKVLVYHYRPSGAAVVNDGLAVVKQSELDKILQSNPYLQSSTKAIPRGATAIDIHQRDLLTASQSGTADEHPNAEANVAGVKMPLSVWLGSTFAGQYSELIILSKKL